MEEKQSQGSTQHDLPEVWVHDYAGWDPTMDFQQIPMPDCAARFIPEKRAS